MAKTKDLFDDSTMTFGEHLECLRLHLWKAIIGLIIAVIFALFCGNHIIVIVRGPIDAALQRHGAIEQVDDLGDFNFLEALGNWWSGEEKVAEVVEDAAEAPNESDDEEFSSTIRVEIPVRELASELHRVDDRYPEPAPAESRAISVTLKSPAFARLEAIGEQVNRPVTLKVEEAFLTYLKVSFVAGFVLASPWVFYQLWLFVAAGLYPHERKYVYVYLPFSLGLFLVGAAFCFVFVFPFVLDFLLGFNEMMGIHPQIRLSEWINFAIMLPLMFGLSFQLPLVMLFLERIDIFDVSDYREKRRLSILVIAIISMMMTPADPMSMLLMMIPLLALYELGVILCDMRPTEKNPFGAEAA